MTVPEYAMIQKGHLGRMARMIPAKKPIFFLPRSKKLLPDFEQGVFSHGIQGLIK
jgi:hypothetical protein